MSSPAIVLRSKFVISSSNTFRNYIQYMDRDDAKQNIQFNNSKDGQEFNTFFSYIDYMKDDKKQGNLFTAKENKLNDATKKEFKGVFQKAQKNGSPMWQDVISFDNDWLEKQGLYHSDSHTVDEYRMQNVVRDAMQKMLGSEKMKDSAIWTASIHYNTDNIHVHVATVEPNPSRSKKEIFDKQTGKFRWEYRGNRKKQSLDKLKSNVVNKIMDRSIEHEKINHLIRDAVKIKNQYDDLFINNRKTKKNFMNAMKRLPDDRRQWKYGYHSINDARPYIDKIVDKYLQQYHKKEMNELHQKLDIEVQVMKDIYGEDSQYKDYKKNKLDDLKKRMGNAVLSEIRKYDKKLQYERYQGKQLSNQNVIGRHKYKPYKENIMTNINVSVVHLTNAMRKTFHDYQTERKINEFDQMMDM